MSNNTKKKTPAKKTTTKKSTAKSISKNSKKEEKVVEKGSLWAQIQPRKESDGRVSFSQAGLIFLVVMLVILMGCSFIIGHNFDSINPFTSSKVEDMQSNIEKKIAQDIEQLNKKLPSDNQLDSKADFLNSGTVTGQSATYDYYQYVVYTKNADSYVSWIVNKTNGDLLSIFVFEEHLTNSSTSTSKIVMKEIVENLYKDKISSENSTKMLEYLKSNEYQVIYDNNFAYLQQFDTEDMDEGHDYMSLHEIDFFRYIPSNDNTSGESSIEISAEGSESTAK